MKRPGQPKFIPTKAQRNQVSALCACGVPRKQVAEYIGVDQKTLNRYFRKEIAEAVTRANAKIATVLYQKALAGDTVSVLFWLKCRANWKESARHELTGADGKPLEMPAFNLGISFAGGGPGHDPALDAIPAGIEVSREPQHIETPLNRVEAPERIQSDTPAPPATTRALYETLAMPADEFTRLPRVVEQSPPEPQHEHRPLPDSICAQCRALWVAP